MKLKSHPAIWVAGTIIFLSLGFRQLWLNTCITSTELERSLDPARVPLFVSPTLPDSTPSLTENTAPENTISLSSDPVSQGIQAALRVSNRTNHPVRVAWRSPNNEAVHWDFAPQEGNMNGLILSLPETDLTLEPGDLIVVFAQDGSREYWGPFLVGKTDLPAWNSQLQEWQLLIQP